MISDDDLAKLPPSPEAAFARLVEILDSRLSLADKQSRPSRAQQYVQVLLAFIDEHDLEATMGVSISRNMPKWDSGSFEGWLNEFQNTIKYYQARCRFRSRNASTDAITIALNSDYRSEIHDLLNKIRKVVANLEISDRKRDAIYGRISALESEIDKSRTRIDALMALMLEASETTGEVAERLEPVVKLAERVRALFAKARAENEPPALPAPDDPSQAKRIAGPAEAKDGPKPQSNDDIPF
jgi:hypothetical protein